MAPDFRAAKTRQSEVLSAKARFIQLVVKGELVVKRRKLLDLVADLRRRGFVPFQQLKGTGDASTDDKKGGEEGAEAEEENDDEEEDEDAEKANKRKAVKQGVKDYDYLVGMPISSLTAEKIEELMRQHEVKQKELTEMKKKTPKKLWLDDLDLLEQGLNKREEDRRLAEEDSKAKVAKARKEAATVKAAKGKKRAASPAAVDAEAAPKPKKAAPSEDLSSRPTTRGAKRAAKA